MAIKRHYVLYGFLALSLITAVLVFMIPGKPEESLMATSTPFVQLPAEQGMRYEVVTTEAQQELGLGGRADIPEDYGMLFVFPTSQRYGFWMKDMLTDIDIIWLSDTGDILKIDDSVPADSYLTKPPTVFYAPEPVKYVLETRAGEARRRGWTVGTKVSAPLPEGS